MKTQLRLPMAALFLTAACTAWQAQADVIYGLNAGVEGWFMETTGGFANQSQLTNFNFDDEAQSKLYLALEHPIPFVPNFKVSYNQLDTSGDTTLTNNFEFSGQNYAAGSQLDTSLDVEMVDYILYYEVLDNDLVSIDIGIDAKAIEGTVDVSGSGVASSSNSFDVVVPTLYSRAVLGLPLTNWWLVAEGSALALDDNSITDVQAALAYTVIDTLAVDMTLHLGYRSLNVELDDVDELYADIDFEGVYLGFDLDF